MAILEVKLSDGTIHNVDVDLATGQSFVTNLRTTTAALSLPNTGASIPRPQVRYVKLQ